MSLTSITLAEAASPSTSSTSTSALNKLTSEDFMTLMMKELQSQDPNNPMSTSDMVNQMSQMSMISTFEELNSSFTSLLNLNWITLSTSMLGKSVTYLNSDKESIQGIVNSIEYSDSKVYLNVGDEKIELTDITSVNNGSETDGGSD